MEIINIRSEFLFSMKMKIKRYINLVNPYSACGESLTEVEGGILPRKRKTETLLVLVSYTHL